MTFENQKPYAVTEALYDRFVVSPGGMSVRDIDPRLAEHSSTLIDIGVVELDPLTAMPGLQSVSPLRHGPGHLLGKHLLRIEIDRKIAVESPMVLWVGGGKLGAGWKLNPDSELAVRYSGQVALVWFGLLYFRSAV